jgi:Spy/CpxP family protein refolding chaperone
MRTSSALRLAAGLVLIVAVVSAGVVLAQAPGSPFGKGRGFGFRRMIALSYMARQLNLTDQQKQQIRDIVKSHKDDIKALVDQGFAARKALRQAIASGNNDQVAGAVSQLSGVELNAAQLRAQIRAKIFSDVLQPDQRAKADQLSVQFEQKADRWRQRIDQFLDQL